MPTDPKELRHYLQARGYVRGRWRVKRDHQLTDTEMEFAEVPIVNEATGYIVALVYGATAEEAEMNAYAILAESRALTEGE
jgi:hypothetical protein